MRDTGTVHLLSVRCGAKVTTLPSQPQLEEYRELSAPLRAEIRRRVDNAVRPAHTTPAS
ncbi:hypothetical protein [Nocardia tenerifensis]|nr:hypothetical protein [Nocardia tenerifensis]